MKEDYNLDRLLSKRATPQPGDYLAQRIIGLAAYTKQKSQQGLLSWVNQVFAEFTVLKPAYLLITLLFIGFFTGLLVRSSPTSDLGIYSSDIESFLYNDEVIL